MSTLSHFQVDNSQTDRITVWIGKNAPGVNVLNKKVFDELNQLCEGWEASSSTLPIVFRTENPTGFIVGADIKAMAKMTTEEEIRTFLGYGQKTLERLGTLKRQTIALVQGACLGGGFEFALSCRYRIGSENGRTCFGLPETKLGLLPGWGGTQWLPRIVGLHLAIRMLLRGDPITLDFAQENRLVDEVSVEGAADADLNQFLEDLGPDELRRTTWEIKELVLDNGAELATAAQEIAEAEFGPLNASQQAIMTAMKAGLEQCSAVGLQAELDLFYNRLMSEEAQAAFARFKK